MSVVALSHEIGTRGAEIAMRLSHRLQFSFIDDVELENRLVQQLSSVGHSLGTSPSGFAALQQPLRASSHTVARHAIAAILELAAYGRVVIRGWGATAVLRDHPTTFRIRLTAPICYRLEVLADRYPRLSKTALRDLVDVSDASLPTNLEPVLGPIWRSGAEYDLIVATHERTIVESVDAIEQIIYLSMPHLRATDGKAGGEARTVSRF